MYKVEAESQTLTSTPMIFTGRGSELLYQAGGATKRRVQEGERKG